MNILRCPNCEAPYEQRDIKGDRAVCEYCDAVTNISRDREPPAATRPARPAHHGQSDQHGHRPGVDAAAPPVGTVKIVKVLIRELKRQGCTDMARDPNTLKRLLDAAHKAAAELDHAQEAVINLPFIAVTGNGPVHLQMKVTRSFLEFDN